ncbi:MAG: hypothetical protein IJ341_00140 [Bacteroidales bacterium]|nr:hypothetical protein [Bacteroidales bacterium]MBQ7818085.1 hypothetical protein [Bacteroidales bacterium]
MKVDLLRTIIAIAIGVILAYACYEICNVDDVKWVITIGSFITLTIPLTLAMGICAEKERSLIMLSIVSWITFIVEIITNSCFVFADFSIPVYIIINGLILLIYLLIYNSIYRAGM